MTADARSKIVIFDEKLIEERDYWISRLSRDTEPSNLWLDYQRPGAYSGKKGSAPLVIGGELHSKLNGLAGNGPFLLYTTLMVVLKTCLYKYTANSSIAVGSPARGDDSSVQPNALVILSEIDDRLPFRQMLLDVRQTLLDAYARQDYPFERLLRDLRIEHVYNKCPLFDVALALKDIHTDLPDVKNDITITFTKGSEQLNGMVEFNSDLFKPQTVERFTNHFINVLEAALENVNAPISGLSILDQQEREQILVEWNSTQKSCAKDVCAHELFEAQVAQTPGALAVDDEQEAFTYQELNRRANQLAHYLRRLGAGPEAIGAICAERSSAMLVGILGMIKSGAAYLPLDPSYPRERLAFILRDAGVRFLVTQQKFAEALSEHAEHIICLDADRESIERESGENVSAGTLPDNLAYVIYTSGSTGMPKGVELKHSGLVNLITWHQQTYKVTGEDRATQVATPAFDASVWEVWPYITAGASIHIPDDETRASSSKLMAWLAAKSITLSFLPTPLAEAILDEPCLPDLVLRVLLTGGDRLQKGPRRDATFSLVNHYGPTESTVVATCAPVEVGNEACARPPIGRPIDNTQAYLLNSKLQPVPTGVPGELYIGGDGLARGYLKRPDMTADRFIPNPFSGLPGERLYRTGDLARYLPDGNIDFIGRLDQQVKLWAYRIELGEIEVSLSRHPAVSSNVVIAREDSPGDKRLAAYVVLQPEQTATAFELRSFLKAKLPEYMVPSAFVILDKLPLTPNGKVDRNALPEPNRNRQEVGETFVAPRNQIEEILAGIWAQVLVIEQVSIYDNFFDIGGHSLLATQVISRVRQSFEVEIPLRQIFETPTVIGLAESIEATLRSGTSLQSSPIERAARDGNLPLSFAQQRLWFLDQMEPGSPIYNMPAAIRLRGRLDIDALERTLSELVRRHEVLRTTFSSVAGLPVQVVHDPYPVLLPQVDLSLLPDAERDASIKQLIAEEAQSPFDLGRGPLMRATLLRSKVDDCVVLFTTHHIVSDGWSIAVLIDEVANLYEAYLENRPSPLVELPIQYSDFAAWQRQWIGSSAWEADLSYWKQQLADAPFLLELPTDRPRRADQTYSGAVESFVLSPELSESLRELSRKEGVTLFMTMLAAFNTLLYRYTGQDDFLVGTSIANRDKSEIEHLIGFFVNTLVLRAELRGNPSFRELIGRARETALGAYTHQSFPFEKLVEEMRPERNLTHTPLFQVMIAMHNMPRKELELPGLKLEAINAGTGMAIADLGLSIEESGGRMFCLIDYHTDLFDNTTIVRIIGHFQCLLEEIVKDPDKPVSNYQFLTKPELHQLLVEWNSTFRDYPQDKCIHELFEAQAEQSPNNVAAVYQQQQLTYDELNRRANQLARYLRDKQVRAGEMVGIYLAHSIETVVALLGVLKSSAAYVPIDIDYPAQRVSAIISDAKVKLIITQEQLKGRLAEVDAEVVCIDSESADISQQQEDDVIRQAGSDSLAYVIYTSGSTGKPKGVMIRHKSLVNYICWARDMYARGERLSYALYTSLGFDLTVTSIFTPLVTGGRVVVYDTQSRWATLEQILIDDQVDVIKLTPSHLTMIKNRENTSSRVRLLIVGGEALETELARQVSRSFGGEVEIVNEYGPSEATVGCMYYRYEASREQRGWVPIGRPAANTEIYVLDEKQEMAGVGIEGEMYIGGEGLGSGYMGMAEKTAEKFIPNKYSKREGDRLYRTGDLGRYLETGEIEFVGRKDDQVKLRGYRIELGEIEAALSQHAEIRNAVVIVREEKEEDKRLVAYIVSEEQEKLSAEELKEYLKQKLPGYMIPSAIMMIDEIPLTANGKIDRRALPAPEQTTLENSQRYVGPRNLLEYQLIGIWEEILDQKGIGVRDDFFNLGGHSLLATQVVSRVRDAFQIELSVRKLFEAPTIATLATAIEQAIKAGERLQAPAIQPVSRALDLPLSFAQQRLWFLDQLEPNNPFYNLLDSVLLTGELNVPALEQSLNQIINRHEVLKTTFATVEGRPVQVISESQNIKLPVVDLTGLPETERKDQALRHAKEEALQPFDLAHGPLIRMKLLRLNEQEHVALVATHHIIGDAWSTRIFIRELTSFYEASLMRTAPVLPDLPIQYADFAYWQRQWMQGEVLESELSYWKQKLDGAPPVLELPTDRPRPPVMAFRGAREYLMLPASLSEALKGLSRRESVTLFMTLLAAFKVLLYHYTRQSDIVVGTPIANRNRGEIEGLIGFFTNTLVLRSDLSGDPTFTELLRRVRETALESYAHQDLPFEKLVEELQPERSLSHTPLFQVMFLLQNVPVLEVNPAGLMLSPFGGEIGTSKFDLVLSMEDTSEGMFSLIEYDVDLFDASTIRRMLDHFNILLAAIAANPDQRIASLPMLTQTERHQLLDDWTDTRTDFRNVCVHELFEEQVERTPEAVAVMFEQVPLTYLQLNRQANQLAHHLQALGVGPDVPVGICVDRSIEMVVGVLAILKAGGAYVPLDPAYPKERLAFMLEDSNALVLLTQERLLEALPPYAGSVICLDTDWNEPANQNTENPVSRATVDNLLYVIYTSGSTGKPKGIGLPHGSLTNLIQWHLTTMLKGARMLQFASLSFDASFHEIFAAWCSGGTLLLISEELRRDIVSLARFLQEEKVEKAILPVIVLQQLAEEYCYQGRVTTTLKEITTTGEQMQITPQIIQLFKLWDDCALHNHYGPSESHVVTAYTLDGDPDLWASHPSIGCPIANTEIYLLDHQMTPVPVGVAGELYIGGVSLARGYLDRPDLTAEKFIPNPFGREPGERLYKTGDLSRYLPDGNIEFLGRIDHQVKLRGYRIELGEIEAVLNQHPDVRESIVTMREVNTGDKRLVAYIVPDPLRAPVISGQQRIQLPNNMAIAYINRNEVEAIYEEIFEDLAHTLYGITIGNDDCIFDVGANIGLFTLFACTQGRDVSVYAFEPNPAACEVLRINAALYGSDVKVFDCGLSDREMTAEFTYYPRASVWSGFYADPDADENYFRTAVLNQQMAEAIEHMDDLMEGRFDYQKIECRLRRISDLIREHQVECIDLLKIDVERAELDVLRGIDEADWGKIRQAVIEVHDIDGRLENICTLLKNNGFDIFVDQERLLIQTDMYHVYAMRTSDCVKKAADRLSGNGDRPPVEYKPLLTTGELQSYLSQKLPDYMMPSNVVMLEKLPLTPNGKIDRRALPAPDQARQFLNVALVAPRSPAEKVVARIWEQILGIDEVGVEDNFFRLGGHSLLATQMMFRLREVFQIDLALRSLFEQPTVEGLVKALTWAWKDRELVEEIARTYLEIDQLSDEEMSKLLSEEVDGIQ
jgi:amino acid adenylation domain-containing protein/FkbM family methyltransferase